MPTKREFILRSKGVDGYVEVSETDRLSDVRKLILEDFDEDQLPGPNFVFHVNEIRVSTKQEGRRLAYDILDQNANVEIVARQDIVIISSPPPAKLAATNVGKNATAAIIGENAKIETESRNSKLLTKKLGKGDMSGRFNQFCNDEAMIFMRLDNSTNHTMETTSTRKTGKTINKDGKEVEKLLWHVYPRCALCRDSVGAMDAFRTSIMCSTCRVPLCRKKRLGRDDTCFKLFHNTLDLKSLPIGEQCKGIKKTKNENVTNMEKKNSSLKAENDFTASNACGSSEEVKTENQGVTKENKGGDEEGDLDEEDKEEAGVEGGEGQEEEEKKTDQPQAKRARNKSYEEGENVEVKDDEIAKKGQEEGEKSQHEEAQGEEISL